MDAEKDALKKFLPSLKGEVALQMGGLPLLPPGTFPHQFLMLDELEVNSVTVSEAAVNMQLLLGGHDPFLPFASSSVDLCLLPHVLDFAQDPHHILRQSRDVLVSGGYLVIYGFNPISLWGLRGIFSRSTFPWNGHRFTVYRIRDWLRLLEFHISGGMMLYYSLPVENQKLKRRFDFLESAGDRWWPMLGSVYLLVAQKIDVGMTVIDFREQFSPRSYLNIPEPVARTIING